MDGSHQITRLPAPDSARRAGDPRAGARPYGSVQSILRHGLDRQPPAPSAREGELPLLHPNIRGSGYYH